MQINKLVIIGNSVALRIRPPSGLNYGALLEAKLTKNFGGIWNVINMGRGRATSNEIVLGIDDYVRIFPKFYIINLGAVDAPSREIPLWYSDILYGKRRVIFSKLFLHFYNLIIRPNRAFFVKLRAKTSWISKYKFKKNITNILETLKKDTNAEIFLLGINAGNQRIEKLLPGTVAKYKSYNDILKSLSDSYNISFIDLQDLKSESHFPDGVHYNAHGHHLIAERIYSQIVEVFDESHS